MFEIDISNAIIAKSFFIENLFWNGFPVNCFGNHLAKYRLIVALNRRERKKRKKKEIFNWRYSSGKCFIYKIINVTVLCVGWHVYNVTTNRLRFSVSFFFLLSPFTFGYFHPITVTYFLQIHTFYQKTRTFSLNL